MPTVGQTSLHNFYVSVQFDNPALAEEIASDVEIVGLYALGADKSQGVEAADRLRRVAFNLPVIQSRVLESALRELGY